MSDPALQLLNSSLGVTAHDPWQEQGKVSWRIGLGLGVLVMNVRLWTMTGLRM